MRPPGQAPLAQTSAAGAPARPERAWRSRGARLARSARLTLLALPILGAAADLAWADHGAPHPGDLAAGGAERSSFNPLGALKDLVGGLAGGGQSSEFLNPEVAFVLSSEAAGADVAVVRWDIADGYYLYRERFKFVSQNAGQAVLGAVELPQGKVKEDPYFGRMEVYYQEVEARLPVGFSDAGSRALQLEVTYQGCADAGLCYPPITKTVALSLPPASAGTAGGSVADPGSAGQPLAYAPAGDLPEQDRLARALATGNTGLVLLAFFGLGLLLTFTPCVLPMIPILSSIIVGQGERLTTGRAFRLSLTYVLAMSATYTAAGVAAGLTGANLQAAFQNPWVLGAFSAVFVALALSMFGLYDLQVPVSLQQRLMALSNRQRGGTYAGVGVMGFLSALIVGPCVAAPLAGALIYIARTGDALLGGAALFALSLGMGVPVLAIGTSAGRLVPKVGPWMRTVKSVFGVILIGVAIYLLERLLPGWLALLLWAALFVGTAVFLAMLGRDVARPAGWRRLAQGLGLASLTYGVLLTVGAANGGDDVFRPLEGVGGAGAGERAPLSFKEVKGLAGLESELRIASAARRSVMLDFYADWCVSCKELERYTFSDPEVQAVLSNAVLLRTDVTANDADDQALLERFGLFGPPAILFFGPNGVERPRYRVVGFMEAESFRTQAERGLDRAIPARALRAPKPGGRSDDA